MKCVTASTFVPRFTFALMAGSLIGLAGCDSGSDSTATAPGPKVEGAVAPGQATEAVKPGMSSEEYNKVMREKMEASAKTPNTPNQTSKKH